MKKPLFCILSLFLLVLYADAQQKITPTDLRTLRKKEDSLKNIVKNIMLDSFTAGRMRSDSVFTRTLVRGLQVKNSFYYPFDSLKGIGKVYAPDSTFRILTWQIHFDDYWVRQRGAIQYRTPDGSLKLVSLVDASEFTNFPEDSARKRKDWIGAVYYNIIQTKHEGKNYYTLFGFDGNGVRSNKKWIDVLTFDAQNMPVFGDRKFFTFEYDSTKRGPMHRFSNEYKKDASALLNYEPELGIILVDHLISESDEPELAYTFVPDGDYEGFKWENGRWVHIDKVFTQKLEDGQAPVPNAIRDNKGDPNEEKNKPQNEKAKPKKKDN